MSRPRIYPTPAARQKAYRDRQRQGTITVPIDKAPPRPPSRPRRVAAIVAALHRLADEYRDWREALPESLAESAFGEQLDETGEQLDQLADDLADLELPRGFGR